MEQLPDAAARVAIGHTAVPAAVGDAGDAVLGRGSGKSKKLAEAEAARSALERLSANFTQ